MLLPASKVLTQYAEQHAHTRYNAILALFSYPPVKRYIVSSAVKHSCFLVNPRVAENRVTDITGARKKLGAIYSHWSLKSRNTQHAHAKVRVIQTPFSYLSI